MREESFEIKPISYQIRIIEESDLDSLLLIKVTLPYTVTDSGSRKTEWQFIWAHLSIIVRLDMCYCHWKIKKTSCHIQTAKNVRI